MGRGSMTNSPQSAQQKIDHIQALYRQWLQLSDELDQAYQTWQQAMAVMKELETFYFDGEYLALSQAIDEGLKVDLTTQGEYSVMSEDALWNAFYDKEVKLWQMLRFATKHLDKFQGDDTHQD